MLSLKAQTLLGFFKETHAVGGNGYADQSAYGRLRRMDAKEELEAYIAGLEASAASVASAKVDAQCRAHFG